MAMRKEDQDKLAEKMDELGRHAQRQKELTAEAQATARCIVETYSWLVDKLAAAQILQTSVQKELREAQEGPPPKPC